MKNISQLAKIVNSGKLPKGLTEFEQKIVEEALALLVEKKQMEDADREARSITMDFFK